MLAVSCAVLVSSLAGLAQIARSPASGGSAGIAAPSNAVSLSVHSAAAVNPATSHNPFAAIATITVGGLPQFATYDAANREVYVPNWANSNVSVVNGTVVTATLVAGGVPFSATYDPKNELVYIVNEGSNNVTVFNGTHTVANIPVGTTPQFASWDSFNGWIYVSNSGSANVTVINGTAVIATINVGTDPSRVVVGSGGGGGGGGGWDPSAGPTANAAGPDLYVPNSGSGNVSVIGGVTGHNVIASVNVGADPQFATWDPSNVWLYVPNNHSGNVSVLSSTSPFHVLYTIPVGTNPWSASFDPTTNQVLVVNYGSGTVSVLGGALATSVVATVHVGANPEFLTQDAAAGAAILVPNTGSGNVSVIVGTKVVGSISAGGAPIFGTLDPNNGFVYVQNFGTANVTVLGAAFAVTFRALGLPSGSPWAVHYGSPVVTRSNTTMGSVGAVTAAIPGGPLTFSFTEPAGFALAKITGPGLPSQTGVNLTGPAVFVVHFAPFETLWFNETGLPPGALWGIAIQSALPHGGPGGQNATTNTTSIRFTVVADAWKFSITSKPSTYLAVPHRGTVGVPNHNVTKRITFKLESEHVTFSETGLAPGTLWGVNISGSLSLAVNSTHSVIAVSLPNGSYTFAYWNFTGIHPHPANGSLVVVVPHAGVAFSVHYTALPLPATPARTAGPTLALGPAAEFRPLVAATR